MKREILELKLKNTGSLENVVDAIQLKASQLNERKYYIIDLEDPDPQSFTPFDELTDEILLNWVDEKKSVEEIKQDFIEIENRKASTAIKQNDEFTVRDHVKEWEADVSYSVGEKVYYTWNDSGSQKSDFFEVVQSHTSQAGWNPKDTAALFTDIVYFGDESSVGYPPWKQPQGAHDAYTQGQIVSYSSSLYESDINANVWAPPEQWSVYDPNATGSEEPTGSVNPTGSNEWQVGVSYITADVVDYSGSQYIALQDHTSQVGWEPTNTPSLWDNYTTGSATGSIEEWVQPTGGHDAYNTGDQVLYNGSTWESNVDGNVWAPPTQWTEVV